MAKRPRRNHSSAFKAKVALAAIKGDKTLVELLAYFDVHAYQPTQWKTQLLERVTDALMVLVRGNHESMSKLSTPR